MKVVHINSSIGGGAGICAQRIIDATSKFGVESKFLIKESGGNVSGLEVPRDWAYNGKGGIFIRAIKKLYRAVTEIEFRSLCKMSSMCWRKGDPVVSLPISVHKNIWDMPEVKEADIVHLHWVAGLVDYATFFKNATKPIVWTLHDENPGLGVFHYSTTNSELLERYGAVDRKSRKIKKHALSKAKNLTLVAISNKMKDFIENNEALQVHRCCLINNGIDGNVFAPRNKTECRQKLGISCGRKVFLFSSYTIEDERKGLHFIIDALNKQHDDKVTLVCLGNYKEIPKASFDIRCVGLITDNSEMCDYYSAADFFLMTSTAESFGQTPLEAMACGTPVVGFPCGVMPELVNDANGIVTSNYDSEELEDAIKIALTRKYDGAAIRNDVLARYNYDLIASKYVDLYNKVLGK